jgi:hypothetical protein
LSPRSSLPESNNILLLFLLNHQKWKNAGLSYQANPLKNGVFSIGHLNKVLVELATVCGFTDPTKNTAHSKRKFAITSLVTSKEEIGHQDIKLLASHKNDDAHRVYQQGAAVLHDRRFRAIWGAGKRDEHPDESTEGEYLEFQFFTTFIK